MQLTTTRTVVKCAKLAARCSASPLIGVGCTNVAKCSTLTSSEKAPTVAIVYGSFERGFALAAANTIRSLAPDGIHLNEPQSGTQLDFNALKDVQFLILASSSQNGFPPANLSDFAHNLLLAAQTGEDGCLSHLQHAVWGEGDERWRNTFMNVPRVMDLVLQECGSRRFYSRGEANEPHAPTGAERVEVTQWAHGMWAALQNAAREGVQPVPWDAQWATMPSSIHHEVAGLELEALVRRHGELRGSPSVFARPDDVYHAMIDEVRREREDREARVARRRAARQGKVTAKPYPKPSP